MAPKGKNRKLKTVKFVDDKGKDEDDTNGIEEKADDDVENDEEEFTLDEVLRLGGTKVRKRAIPVSYIR